MACWNFITAYAASSEFLASQDWLGMNSVMKSSFVNTSDKSSYSNSEDKELDRRG